MNFKRNYVTILLLTTLFIFLSCSDDNSNIDALQNGNKEEALLREKLGLPKQNLTLEEIEEIKKNVTPLEFKTIEEAKKFIEDNKSLFFDQETPLPKEELENMEIIKS